MNVKVSITIFIGSGTISKERKKERKNADWKRTDHSKKERKKLMLIEIAN